MRTPIARREFLQQTLGAAALAAFPLQRLRPQIQVPVREFSLVARATNIDVGGGRTWRTWTYNGMLPGPELRVREGERLRVVLTNELPDPTSIHWHGLPVPNAMDGVPGVTQAPVMPGESFTYEFAAAPAGTYFYHPHVGLQLDRGLYGALITARPFVRSRSIRSSSAWASGTTSSCRRWTPACGRCWPGRWTPSCRGWSCRSAYASSGERLRPVTVWPSGLVLGGDMMSGNRWAINGQAYPEADVLRVAAARTVQLSFRNATMMRHPMHLHGHFFRLMRASGVPLPGIENDTVLVEPMQHVDVDFTADNPGRWFLHCHHLYHMELGMARVIEY